MLSNLFPTAREAQIAGEKGSVLSDTVARTLSIWSIAGITVARLGVPLEKKRVASLKIYGINQKQII